MCHQGVKVGGVDCTTLGAGIGNGRYMESIHQTNRLRRSSIVSS